MNRLASEAHVVEEIGGMRCSIVEKNVSPERVEFLKKLLEHNGYAVMIAQTPPPPAKPAPKPVAPSVSPKGEHLHLQHSPLWGEMEGGRHHLLPRTHLP